MCVCVRYVPGLWVDQMESLPDVGKNEINIVNQQLVNRLKSTDTAFSLGTYSYLHTVLYMQPSIMLHSVVALYTAVSSSETCYLQLSSDL